MKPDSQDPVESQIERELKALPELAAPATLAPRVMAAIRAGMAAEQPWYRRAWTAWPMPMQAATLLLLLAVFGGLCYAGWRLPQTGLYANFTAQAAVARESLGSFFNFWSVLINAVLLVFEKLGPGFYAAVGLSLALGYSLCIGLGTLYVRLVSARR
jgi:hypothetical protein